MTQSPASFTQVSSQELKDSRVVTMEVEARNLDKKVCVEGDPGVSRMKGTGMVCWGSGGGQGSGTVVVSS